MRIYILALLLFSTALVTAQTEAEPDNAYAKSPIFLQVGLGLLPHPEAASAELSAAAGYRFNHAIGLGIEYRYTYTSNVSFGNGATLLGLRFRTQPKSGFLASFGAGTVLHATQGDDAFLLFDYKSGGYYFSGDLGYQFRWGLILGVYGTVVQNQVFNVSEWNDSTNSYEPTGRTFLDKFGSGGIKIGYGWPLRGRRR